MILKSQTTRLDAWEDLHWQADTQALLGEHHLAVWSASLATQTRFAASMHRFLSSQPDTESWLISGDGRFDIETFAPQFALLSASGSVRASVDGHGGLVAALRSRASASGDRGSRFRYLIWHQADQAIARDRDLFGRLLDAMLGVSAELEFAGEDLFLIQRVIVIGGERLREYAGDPRGQFRRWWPDGAGQPFWSLVSGVERPPVLAHAAEKLMQGGAHGELELALG